MNAVADWKYGDVLRNPMVHDFVVMFLYRQTSARTGTPTDAFTALVLRDDVGLRRGSRTGEILGCGGLPDDEGTRGPAWQKIG